MRFESVRSSGGGRAVDRGRGARITGLLALAAAALAAAGSASGRIAPHSSAHAPAEARALRSPDSVETAVRRLLTEQEEAWNAGDLDGFMRGYWDSPELVFTSGGSVHRGFEDLARRYRETYGTGAEMGRLAFGGLEVHALGDSAAWVLGTWALEHRGERLGGVFTLVLRRFDEGWRIVHDHTSSGPPAREGEP
jgi:beta-aspartyl-peptidase (threonine type)